MSPLLVALVGAAPSTARVVDTATNISFDANPVVDGTPFVCLGAGLRKKAFFKVYAVSFCVEEEAARAHLDRWFATTGKRHGSLRGDKLAEALQDDQALFQTLMAMSADKLVEMVFVRDVSRDKIKSSFTDSLVQALGPREKMRIAAFVENLPRGVKSGEHILMRGHVNGDITVRLGDRQQDLHDEVIAPALWIAYLGPDSITPTLKKAVAAGVARLRAQPRQAVSEKPADE